MQDLLELSHDVAARQILGEGLESALVDDATLARWAAQCAPELLQLHYQMLLQGLRDLQLAPEGRIAFSMCVLRLLAFRPVSAAPAAGSPSASATSTAAAVPAARSTQPAEQPRAAIRDPVPVHARQQPATAVIPGASSTAPAVEAIQAQWGELLEAAALRGSLRELALRLEPRRLDGDQWEFALTDGYEYLLTDYARGELVRVLSSHVGRPLRMDIGSGGQEHATQAAVVAVTREREKLEREQGLSSDATVQALQDVFGARRIEES
jgi:DNA polymerase-3 subunit gamma/tau